MRSYFTQLLRAVSAFTLCCLITTVSSAQTAQQFFEKGVSHFAKNELDQARTQFAESLKLAPNNPQTLYNLGLVELKAKNEGLALGLWRKALALEPSNSEVSGAINFVENSLPQRAVSRGADLFENFRKAFLVQVPFSGFLVMNFILFVFAGWLLIRYFAARSRAIENEEPSPPPPYIGYLFAFFFLISVMMVAAKTYDMNLIRGTVTTERVEVKTSPEAEAATLFELFEGLEVIVRQSRGDWMQVNYPGGLTGWVPASSVYLTSGRAQ